jgi:hypothetical protein
MYALFVGMMMLGMGCAAGGEKFRVTTYADGTKVYVSTPAPSWQGPTYSGPQAASKIARQPTYNNEYVSGPTSATIKSSGTTTEVCKTLDGKVVTVVRPYGSTNTYAWKFIPAVEWTGNDPAGVQAHTVHGPSKKTVQKILRAAKP